MKKINNYLKEIGLGFWFKATLVISVILIVAGFCVPPMGVIDGSVLIAVGELMLFVNIPVFFAHASGNKVEASLDLDDKEIKLSTTPKNTKK